MYWPIQEKVVFSIVFFIVFCFQILSVLTLEELSTITQFILITGPNLFAIVGMIYYAKWVWKLQKFMSALKKVVIYEIVLTSFFIVFWFLIKLKLQGKF